MTGTTRYDEILYPTFANAGTHPDRLATIATLAGLVPTPVSACRMLELGCGNADNLIAIAASLPDSHFVGVDLAAEPIAAGQRLGAELGLTNVTLLAQDMCDLPESLGMFDYIVAHGVYSWIPADTRDGMLRLISQRLAPNGVAFVSYNVYPGCYLRRMAWEILKFHVEGNADPRGRINEAKALAALIADPENREQATNSGLRHEFRELAKRPDSVLFHDDLAEINEPVYFHEFAAHALDHGLQFLGEAEFQLVSERDIAPSFRAVLGGMDRLSREQYLDFVRARRFRQTLLCHEDLAPDQEVVPERLSRLWAIAPKIPGKEGLAFPSPAPAAPQDASAQGRNVAPTPTKNAEAEAVLREITVEWPLPVAVAELAARERARTDATADGQQVPRRLAEILVGAYGAGLIELHSYAPPVAQTAGDRPAATALARAQNRRGGTVTNLWHENLALDDPVARQVLALLDGSRDRATLLKALGEALPSTDAESRGESLERYLQSLVRLGLIQS
jgi:SAM-dependent methyltransferase